MKNKFKTFYEEHETMCKVVGLGTVAVVGSVVGWKLCTKFHGFIPGRIVVKNEFINTALKHAMDTYKDSGVSHLVAWHDTPIKLGELGKLAELCKLDGVDLNMNQELTHFICIGKPMMD